MKSFNCTLYMEGFDWFLLHSDVMLEFSSIPNRQEDQCKQCHLAQKFCYFIFDCLHEAVGINYLVGHKQSHILDCIRDLEPLLEEQSIFLLVPRISIILQFLNLFFKTTSNTKPSISSCQFQLDAHKIFLEVLDVLCYIAAICNCVFIGQILAVIYDKGLHTVFYHCKQTSEKKLECFIGITPNF